MLNTCSPWRLTMMVLHDIQPALLFTYGNGPAQPVELTAFKTLYTFTCSSANELLTL